MKIINFILLLALSSLCMDGVAQSAELKSAFQNLSATIKEYKLKTKNVHMASINDKDKFVSSFTKIEYIHPNLVISYSEIKKPGGWSSFVKPGDYIVKIPLSKSTIEVRHYNDVGDGYVCIKSSEGILQTFEGQNELIEDFYFYSSKLNTDKVYNELRHLQNLLISENFTGSLGVSERNKGRVNSSRRSAPRANTPTNKSKSGRYGE